MLNRTELFYLADALESFPEEWTGTWGWQGPLQVNKSFAPGASFILQQHPEEKANGDLGTLLAAHRRDTTPLGLARASRDLANHYYQLTSRDLLWDERHHPMKVAGVLSDAGWDAPK